VLSGNELEATGSEENGEIMDDKAQVTPMDSTVYRSLFRLGKHLLCESDVDRLLRQAMDYTIELAGAERGMIILLGPEGEVLFKTARDQNKQDIQEPRSEVSWTLIRKARDGRQPLFFPNALEEPTLKKSKSAGRLRILSVICIPLCYEKEIFGVVYIDNRSATGIFQENTYAFILEFTDFISIAAHHALERSRLVAKSESLERELRSRFQFESIVGHHPKMVDILRLVSQVADTDATVLITGETGTGKELVARALHFNSGRRDMPFITINCGALPENLLESELFGHIKGAFTGAVKDKTGWFERAHGGTMFLDEVGEMPPALQVKLLRVLQTGEYSPVGSTETRFCDVRVVAAASRDLNLHVQEENFREELYYRLNVIDVNMPSLRERREDIPVLVNHFIEQYGEKYHKKRLSLSGEAEAALMRYDFPGNVRELENIMQRALILAREEEIRVEDLPETVKLSGSPEMEIPSGSFQEAKQSLLERFEKTFIEKALTEHHGVVARAARAAGMDSKNFFQKMKKYRIKAAGFKRE
jgi:transcriptional regulator with GAF, ATPase, and Fis domain